MPHIVNYISFHSCLFTSKKKNNLKMTNSIKPQYWEEQSKAKKHDNNNKDKKGISVMI